MAEPVTWEEGLWYALVARDEATGAIAGVGESGFPQRPWELGMMDPMSPYYTARHLQSEAHARRRGEQWLRAYRNREQRRGEE